MIPSNDGTSGGVRALLRIEGFALFAAALVVYVQSGTAWQWFALLFLAPDLSLIVYAFGARMGAFAYNAAHSTIGPIILAIAARFGGEHAKLWLSFALVWFAHVGFDRALGYGLKYASGFRVTHLGPIGKKHHQPA